MYTLISNLDYPNSQLSERFCLVPATLLYIIEVGPKLLSWTLHSIYPRRILLIINLIYCTVHVIRMCNILKVPTGYMCLLGIDWRNSIHLSSCDNWKKNTACDLALIATSFKYIYMWNAFLCWTCDYRIHNRQASCLHFLLGFSSRMHYTCSTAVCTTLCY